MTNEYNPLAIFQKIYATTLDEPRGYKVEDKEMFMDVMDILEEYGMPTEIFVENLKTLGLKKDPSLPENVRAEYRPAHNLIVYKDDNYFGHELLHVASHKDGITGIVNHSAGKTHGSALKEGIADLFAGLIDDDFEFGYPFERMCALGLSTIYGRQIFAPYFQADPEAFYKGFGDDETEIREFADDLDHYKINLEKYADTIGVDGKEKESSMAHENLKMFFNKCQDRLRKLYALRHPELPENEKYKKIDELIEYCLSEPEMEYVVKTAIQYDGSEETLIAPGVIKK